MPKGPASSELVYGRCRRPLDHSLTSYEARHASSNVAGADHETGTCREGSPRTTGLAVHGRLRELEIRGRRWAPTRRMWQSHCAWR